MTEVARTHVGIIGVGSPFTQDQLGWQLLDALRQYPLQVAGAKLLFSKADRPGTTLLERLQGLDAAILLDAMDAQLPSGSVRLIPRQQLLSETAVLSSHALGVAETLCLGEALGMLPPNLYLLGIQMGAPLNLACVQEATRQLETLFSKPVFGLPVNDAQRRPAGW